MKRFIVNLVASATLLTIAVEASARGRSAQLNPFDPETNAVDARGVRHRGAEFRGKIPWLADVVKSRAPYYPYEERRLLHMGKGWFRIYLELNTGYVTQVRVLKSTGFDALDSSAIEAFHNWRWTPGKWREVELPVTFKISRDDQLSPGAVRLSPF
jgi:TonB family protein